MATKYTLIDIGSGSGSSGGGISGLTANTAVYANTTTSIASSTVTKTELEYVHGVTSPIQTQLGTKAVFPVLTTASSNVAINVSSQSYGNALICNITTTRANEVVLMSFSGTANDTGASAHTLVLGYNVDGGTDVDVMEHTMPTSFFGNMSFSRYITIASANTHSVILRAKNLEGSKTTDISTISQFQVVQF